jgi:hypothetical protein
MVTDASTPGGLLGFIQTYGQYIAFFVQILFWLVMGASVLWATLLFRKLVNALVGDDAPAGGKKKDDAKDKPAAASGSGTTAPKVDQFVD